MLRKRIPILLCVCLLLFSGCNGNTPVITAPLETSDPTEILTPTGNATPTEFIASTDDALPTKEPVAKEENEITETPEPTAPSPTVHVHSFTEEVVNEASCSVTGDLVRTCHECGEAETVIIPATENHIWDKGLISTESTCAVDGTKTFTCIVCGSTKEDVIPASEEHTWNEGKVTKKSTCGVEGIKTFTCILCEETKTQNISVTGEHTWEYKELVRRASCWSTGLESYVCKTCGSTKELETSKSDHMWDWGELTKEPTKTTDGIYTYTCLICGKKNNTSTGTYFFDAEAWGDPHHIRTSNDPTCYIDYAINGSTFTISGKLTLDDLVEVQGILGLGLDVKSVYVSSGEFFSISFSLAGLPENEEHNVGVSTRRSSDKRPLSYNWGNVKILPKDGDYCFIPSLVQEHNFEIMSQWVLPVKWPDSRISEKIQTLSDDIVGNETDDYEKLRLLNYWVADNIYYDHDYISSGSREQLSYFTDEVIETKRTICGGYSNLLQALVQAQGIPCIYVITYSPNGSPFTEKDYMVLDSNHAHVEAYVDGRWVIMDSTWDSNNEYQDGQFYYNPPSIEYFDMTPTYFSYTHKLINRRTGY